MSPAYQVHSTCHVVHLSYIFRCVEELLSQAAAAQCKARRIRQQYPAGKTVPFKKGQFLETETHQKTASRERLSSTKPAFVQMALTFTKRLQVKNYPPQKRKKPVSPIPKHTNQPSRNPDLNPPFTLHLLCMHLQQIILHGQYKVADSTTHKAQELYFSTGKFRQQIGCQNQRGNHQKPCTSGKVSWTVGPLFLRYDVKKLPSGSYQNIKTQSMFL